MSRAGALTVRTPEGVTFSLPLASPAARCLAWAVDFGCISVASGAVGAALALLGLASPDLAGAAAILAYFALSLGYGMALEWTWRGQTVGKRLFHLRVVDQEGLRVRFSQIAARNLLRPLDMFPAYYLLGGAACLLSRRAQRLGDLAAGTAVVRQPPVAEPDLDQAVGQRYNSFRDHPHLAARLRQNADPALAALALRALLRRDGLEPSVRVALFAELAERLGEAAPFPPETVRGLTGEQYVRNAVDILFRPALPRPGG
ncbi:MAG: RDD family protein [Thermodesulfobacteriota bacterium]